MAVQPRHAWWGAASDRGLVRANNEDAYRILSDQRLFAVADGMGGHRGGEVAAALAVAALQGDKFDARDPGAALKAMVEEAHRRILEESRARPEVRGMGTTLTVAHVGPEIITVAHVGDSRAYLMEDGQLIQLTRDHSIAQALVSSGQLDPVAARRHPQRHVLTQALGTQGVLEVDLIQREWRGADCLLLCTDGLTEVLSDARLMEVIGAAQGAQQAAEALIAAAREAGAPDNVTVILVDLQSVALGLAENGELPGDRGSIGGAAGG